MTVILLLLYQHIRLIFVTLQNIGFHTKENVTVQYLHIHVDGLHQLSLCYLILIQTGKLAPSLWPEH